MSHAIMYERYICVGYQNFILSAIFDASHSAECGSRCSGKTRMVQMRWTHELLKVMIAAFQALYVHPALVL
jgi:hypothetical protein